MNRFVSILLLALIAGMARADDLLPCFIPGEVAEYKIYWAHIPLAWATVSTDSIKEEGRDLIRIRMEAQTYKAYTYIYDVNDVTEVIIDPETALPVRLDLVINEGTIHKSQLTTFYHDKKMAIFQDRISKDIREVPMKSNTQELFSFMFSNRYTDLKTFASQHHEVLVNGKLYDVGIKLRGTDEIKLSEYGKVKCTKVEPIADFDGIFIRKGKIFFWISTKDRHMVTCISAKVAVGRITAKLQEVSGPGDDFWTRKD